ncbi:MAG TPA: glutamate synthase-related protein, partial [Burkholderiales bacterium]|nr:glutamate synthase-related protein [Burkholderiales bacterium]
AARGVPIGVDCVSPARHSAFGTPLEMVRFIAQLRELSGGKPVGFKLCIGHPWEFMAICKAMLETGIRADFIVIDGTEGGTGAAPLEFVDHVGTPLREGLAFAHNCLVGAGLRSSIRLGAAGRIVTAFDMARVLALGELIGAAGLAHPNELRRVHIQKRVSPSEVKSFAELFPALRPGELLTGCSDAHYARFWAMADASSFDAADPQRSAA